jgi:hypothetical protein
VSSVVELEMLKGLCVERDFSSEHRDQVDRTSGAARDAQRAMMTA